MASAVNMAGHYGALCILLCLFAVVLCVDNDTSDASDVQPKETKPSGALASLGRMIVDVPLGVVEAFKDGAEVIESVVLAIVRGIFS